MSVAVYIELNDQKIKKGSLEALCYARDLAGAPVLAIALGDANTQELETLGKYGASKVIHIKGAALGQFEAQVYAALLSKTCQDNNISTLVLSNTYTGKALAPRVAVKMNAGLASGVIALPEGNKFKKSVFSGKAFGWVNVSGDKKVIALTPNSYAVSGDGGNAPVESQEAAAVPSKIKVNKVEKVSGKIPLTEAELVVSGGRGMKGPEHWSILEELANTLGAATACSKPVSDMDWRPHSEHVGQTGITIKPNLYIACGISGAIQHLAGISSSKVIVAINKDPEAPFFKIADYGIVGDVFEVIPQLTEAAKKLKNS